MTRPVLPAGLRDGLRDALVDAGRWVLPVECPGCGTWDVPLCAACATAVVGAPVRCEAAAPRLDRLDGLPPLPVWAVAPYAGPVRGMVLAWKDHGRLDLTRTLATAARAAGRALAPELGEAASGEDVLVVPVPTTAHARRRRGADLVAELADAVARGVRDGGGGARTARVLARRRVRDQAGLGARARGRNAAGSVRLRGSAAAGSRRRLDGAPVLLVDDVVTTGATLAACADRLAAAGALVLGAVAVAATPSRTTQPGATEPRTTLPRTTSSRIQPRTGRDPDDPDRPRADPWDRDLRPVLHPGNGG